MPSEIFCAFTEKIKSVLQEISENYKEVFVIIRERIFAILYENPRFFGIPKIDQDSLLNKLVKRFPMSLRLRFTGDNQLLIAPCLKLLFRLFR